MTILTAAIALAGCNLFGFLDGVELQVNGQAVSSQDFGSLLLAASSTPLTVTIVNKGAFPLTLGGLSAITVSGSAAADFALSGSPGESIDGGQSTSFTVTWTPTAPGARSATISIRPYNGGTASLSVTGTATSAGQIGVTDGTSNVASGSTYDAGSLYIGSSRSFTITNTDATNANLGFAANPVTVSSPDGTFALTGVSLANTLPDSGTGTFTVQFNGPQGDTSQHTATITIFNSATGAYTFQMKGVSTGNLG